MRNFQLALFIGQPTNEDDYIVSLSEITIP